MNTPLEAASAPPPLGDAATLRNRSSHGIQPGWQRRAVIVTAVFTFIGGVLGTGFPLCPTAAMFGFPCPGCGMTRATIALLHGDLHAALHLHPLVLLVLPLYGGIVGAGVVSFVRGSSVLRDPSKATLHGSFSRALFALFAFAFVALIAVWIARFFGAFGGPVPVETMTQWAAHHAPFFR